MVLLTLKKRVKVNNFYFGCTLLLFYSSVFNSKKALFYFILFLYLKLDSCQFIDSHMLWIISTNCTQLTHLSMQSCNNIGFRENDVGFKELRHLKNLIGLDLYRTLVDQESIIEILKSCKNLKHLNLGSCVRIIDFDEILQAIAQYCTGIVSLDLWRAYSLTAKGLFFLTCYFLINKIEN
jgi:hypothetical protein